MKKLLTLGALTLAISAPAVLFTSSPGTMVPDNNPNGWINNITISGQSGTITPGSLTVNLELSGGWNGDLYAYLVSSSGGFAVLLDRVGAPTLTYGYGTSGMNVWLTDAAPGGLVLGNIEGTATPTSGGLYSRAGYAGNLASFDGLNPNGTWSLFMADLSGGGVTTVANWGLQMDIVAVPEVEAWIAAALAGAFGAFWVNRQLRRGVKPPE